MKDKELKLEESGVSHTLGAAGKVGRSCARERERQVSVLRTTTSYTRGEWRLSHNR